MLRGAQASGLRRNTRRSPFRLLACLFSEAKHGGTGVNERVRYAPNDDVHHAFRNCVKLGCRNRRRRAGKPYCADLRDSGESSGRMRRVGDRAQYYSVAGGIRRRGTSDHDSPSGWHSDCDCRSRAVEREIGRHISPIEREYIEMGRKRSVTGRLGGRRPVSGERWYGIGCNRCFRSQQRRRCRVRFGWYHRSRSDRA